MVDLLPFCAVEDFTYILTKPWVAGGKAYATDGRIGIRCDAKLYTGPVADASALVPDMEKVLAPIAKVKTWKALPGLGGCEHCGGSGLVEQACDNCGGKGRHYDDSWTCDECNGTGKVELTCRKCYVNLNNRTVSRRFVNLLLPLPGVEWGIANRKPDAAVYFRFAGGDGGVMPFCEPS